MNNRTKKFAVGMSFVFFLMALFSGIAKAEEVPASNFFIRSESAIRIIANPGNVVVFDALENDKYYLEGRDLELIVDVIKVNGDVVISGYKNSAPPGGGEGTSGSNGTSFGIAPDCNNGSPGGTGGNGGEGPMGTNGRAGSVIKIDIEKIIGPGLITFNNNGQDGGTGGRGGRGGDGGKGEDGGQSKSTWHCECGGGNGGPGGNGGNGGIGGKGGDGGNGGTIVLSPKTSQVRQRLKLNVCGGKGSAGGQGGAPGNGGKGGDMGRGGGFCGGGHGAGPGSTGINGSQGQKGADGKQGVIVEW